MIFINFVPSSEIVRPRWWIFDFLLIFAIIIGGWMTVSYYLGQSYFQVEVVHQKAKLLKASFGEKKKLLAAIEIRNNYLDDLENNTEDVFVKDNFDKSKFNNVYTTEQILKILPSEIWLTEIDSKILDTKNNAQIYSIKGQSNNFLPITRFLNELSNNRLFSQNLELKEQVINSIDLVEINLQENKNQPSLINFHININFLKKKSRYAKYVK